MAGKATSKKWLFMIAGLLVSSTRAESKCYDTWGTEDPNQLPCFAPGTTDTNVTTWCCSKDDYCLSNGLCLSPGYNNLMTQQGCTDKAWGAPCNKICSSNDDNGTTLGIPLIPCPASHNADTNEFQFCCGPDAISCCNNAISWTSIPAGTIIRSPGTSTTTSSSSSDSNSYSLKLGLGIGLGLGIPILLVLLAVAYLLAQPIHARRRHHKNKSKSRSNGVGPAATITTEKTSPSSSSTTSSEKKRRDSFGRVDTHVGPPSDDGNGYLANIPHVWPPAPGTGPGGAISSTNVAAAIAQWALRSGFGLAGHHHYAHGATPGVEMEAPPPPPPMQRPGTPQEMDGQPAPRGNYRRSRSRVRNTGGGVFGAGYSNTTAAAAELPGQSSSHGVRVVKVGDINAGRGKVRVAAEEVELPTPDTPERERDVEKASLGGKRAGEGKDRGSTRR